MNSLFHISLETISRTLIEDGAHSVTTVCTRDSRSGRYFTLANALPVTTDDIFAVVQDELDEELGMEVVHGIAEWMFPSKQVVCEPVDPCCLSKWEGNAYHSETCPYR